VMKIDPKFAEALKKPSTVPIHQVSKQQFVEERADDISTEFFNQTEQAAETSLFLLHKMEQGKKVEQGKSVEQVTKTEQITRTDHVVKTEQVAKTEQVIKAEQVERVIESTEKSSYHIKTYEKLTEQSNHSKLRTWKNKGEGMERSGMSESKTTNYRFKKNSPTNPNSPSQQSVNKWQQKQRIKRSYAQQYRSSHPKYNIVTRKATDIGKKLLQVVKSDPKVWFIVFGMAFLLLVICTTFASCSVISTSIVSSTASTTYTSEEADLLEVEAAYQSKETALQTQIDNIETTYPDYDEYVYNLVEIGHDPHQLASLLTALYHVYTLDMVEDILQEIFERQYTITHTPSTETRTDGDGNSYTVTILTTTLTNTPINSFAHEFLTDEQYELYEIILACKGNMPDLFGDYLGGSSGGAVGDVDFEIPDHYLDDEDFAKVYAEAIKYLGYPYAWGGQSPSTSFDCSGFMYWIYNATGVYSHSRLTAGGYYNLCTKFDSSQRQAGDFIFFTGTSSHATISHIGMYIGDGMMIHCASAGVSFAPVDSGYWARSDIYVCYGRLPI
ncbi:MAG: NlpC/P60 family protein, partial [Eubacteriales bacterium]